MKKNFAKIGFGFLFLILFTINFPPHPSFAFDPFTIKLKFWQPPVATATPTPTITPIPEPTIPTPVIPYITNVPPAGLDQVEQLVNSIIANCEEDGVWGRVTMRNFSCVENITPPLPPSVIEVMRISTFNNEYLQCVGFVKAADLIAGGTAFPETLYAKAYITTPPTGYQFVEKNNGTIQIEVGDLPLWDWYTYGHIAYVTKIYDADTFEVAEGHWDGRGQVTIGRIETTDAPYFRGWLRRI